MLLMKSIKMENTLLPLYYLNSKGTSCSKSGTKLFPLFKATETQNISHFLTFTLTITVRSSLRETITICI